MIKEEELVAGSKNQVQYQVSSTEYKDRAYQESGIHHVVQILQQPEFCACFPTILNCSIILDDGLPIFMKHQQLLLIRYFLVCIFSTVCIHARAQFPRQNWALHYGGSSVDIPLVIKFTADGGTVAAGYTTSKDGQVGTQANREYWDLWVVKLNNCGIIQWQRSFGGSGYESARDIVQTPDGGFIVLGETNSTDGDVAAGYGGTKDIWLLKMDAGGTVTWQKRYGGNGLDIGNQLAVMPDGNYLITASTASNDGDISGNHGTGGYTDALLMKINPSGTILWSKCFGGTKNDELLDIKLINGKIFAAGYANSTDGDIPPAQKNYDAWVLALDADGNKMFSKIYGGSQNDVAYSMTVGADASLAVAGYTTSNDGDVSGAKGSQDYWVFNISQSGNLNWQRVLGGSDAEYANTILTGKDSTYLVGGISYSSDGDVTAAKGEGDYWVVKLKPNGEVAWKNNYGGSKNDHLHYMIGHPVLDEYYFAGDSDSGDGDFATGMGDVDFGIIKFKDPQQQLKDSVVCNVADFMPMSDTIRDACGYDSVLVQYNPVPLSGPLDDLKKADTIFIGQSTVLPFNGNGSVTWQADPTLSCYDCPHPVATPVITTVYFATNALPHGCWKTDQFKVVVLKDALVMTPNAFTPNGDGLNDYFGPIGKAPDGYSMQVFNRYGELLFKSSSMYSRWDGTSRGKPQPAASYIYLIQYKDLNHTPKQQQGSFILVR
jgi:gliding motility-associated-like protein